MLASVMLKLGAFGIIRFLFGLVHTVCKDVSTFVLALCLVGII